MRIVTAIGARPQFIKAAPLSIALRERGLEEIIVHSGQHYDDALSEVFFRELGIPAPDRNLNIGSGTQARQTGLMLIEFERAFIELKPDLVIVHGDTNTTLAAALAACKLRIPTAHNEAGLRSFNRTMPEECNRIVADRCADHLFCPTARSLDRLASEGISENAHLVGDLQLDAARRYAPPAESSSDIMQRIGAVKKEYFLLTLHRPYTVDVPSRLMAVMETLGSTGERVFFPVHPRTKNSLARHGIEVPPNITVLKPLGYFDTIVLVKNARMILTDSGGIQKEAYFFEVPCVTIRPETEWMETVETGWNRVTDTDGRAITDSMTTHWWPDSTAPLFGDGHAADKIADFVRSLGG
jgi:UDP-GlcNAc3NAcA epimerase